MGLSKQRLLLYFCLATLTILVVSHICVSWLIGERLNKHVNLMIESITTETYDILDRNIELLNDFIIQTHHRIQRLTERIANDEDVAISLEHHQDAPIIDRIAKVATESDFIDFIMVFDRYFDLVATYPDTLSKAALADYYKQQWPFDFSAESCFNDNAFQSQTYLVVKDLVFGELHHTNFNRCDDHTHLKVFAILSISIVKDDFGDKQGICVAGKILTGYNTELERIYNATESVPIFVVDGEIVTSAGLKKHLINRNRPNKLVDKAVVRLTLPAEVCRQCENGTVAHHKIELNGEWYLSTCKPLFDQHKKCLGLMMMAKNMSLVKTKEKQLAKENSDLRSIILWAFVLIAAVALIVYLLFFILSLRIEWKNQSLQEAIEKDKIIHDQLRIQKKVADLANQAKTSFLAHMSHEIRNPLSGVLLMADHLLRLDLADEVRDSVSGIKKCGKNLLAIVNDILDLSKIESGKLSIAEEAFNLQVAVRDIHQLLRNTAKERNVDFKVDYPCEESSWFIGDELRIKQILINLTVNSIKFSKDESVCIVVRIEEDQDDEMRKRVILSVEDTGVGMSEETLKRVFLEYEQANSSTARKYGGTGLGLTICKKLVQLMAGEINVDSQPGKGTKFTVELSLKKYHPEDENEETLEDLPKFDATILVAEDYIVNQNLLVGMLRELGCEVDIANDGSEAVNLALKNEYDMIITDLDMPEMSGVEATKIIREKKSSKSKKTFIVLTSASSLDKETYKEYGIDDIITKPFFPDDLAALLEKLIPEKKQSF